MKFLLFLAVILWLPVSAAAAGRAALRKRDPRAAAMWMAISIFIPFAGALSYWVFGINRLKRP
ncbi:MAG: PLDc N-terminal domain-containing protein, partial [Proteobacteria bacterium]|nr:PLDc N-terminal domain-containing protein [Pseudomonadota bacterium]